MEKMPIGIAVVRIINALGAVLSVAGGILLAMIAVPNFVKAAQNAGKDAGLALPIIVGAIFVFIGSIPGMLLLLQNHYLRSRKSAARIWQIVIGCLAILSFPVGTVFGLIVLYFMIVDKEVKEYFS